METPQEIAATLPHMPGVYLYKDQEGAVLYVGKAKDLKKRVSQYFSSDIEPGSKTAQLVSHIHLIDTIQTHSEFDAIILEAKLIRQYNPKYNIIAKDDKSPLYLCLTLDEQLPQVLYVRKSSITPKTKRLYFGPFQSGRTLKQVLKELRRIIPYCTQKKRDGKPCFYTHLGLCGPCPSLLTHMPDSPEKAALVKDYRDNIRRLARIMSGESLTVLHDMERQMRELAENEQFEKASAVKASIMRLQQLLQKHYDPLQYLQGDTFLENIYDSEMDALRKALTPYYPDIAALNKVECIDISNTMGTYSTGSLVVLVDGKPARSDYRRFRIRGKDAPNDFAMIAEVVTRRMKHTEWTMPNLLVIDGGKGQVRNAMESLAKLGVSLPLIGLAKRFEEIIVPTENGFHVLKLPLDHKGLHLLERIRDESHRFALTYHKLLRKKGFIESLE